MRILIAGASGFIGARLCRFLCDKHQVVAITRNRRKAVSVLGRCAEVVQLQMNEEKRLVEVLGSCDAVINLAGENIFGRWTQQKKKRILNSRIEMVNLLAGIAAKLSSGPGVFIQGSAIGYYPVNGSSCFDEFSRAADEVIFFQSKGFAQVFN